MSEQTPQRSAPGRLSADSCSVASRARREPLLGSAPLTRGWLLFECPGAWPAKASALFGDLAPEMDRRTAQAEVRPMLVRRPGRSDLAAPRSWWFIDSLEGTWVRGHWADLADVSAALDIIDVTREEPRSHMTPAETMILVCAHAKHDVCCAVRGRPIASELAARWPEQVWECSHLGGDRFAANIAVLPDSTFYGGLDSATAEPVVTDHLAGEVTLGHLRGTGIHRAPAQAALAEVARRAGSRRLADLTVTQVREHGADRWQVEVHGRGALPERSVLTVQRSWGAPQRLTCAALESKPAAEYTVAWG